MKHRLGIVRHALRVVVLAAALAAASAPAFALGSGDPAPVLDLPTQAGKPFRLADYQGRVVFVDFWASWCGPCRQEFPWLNAMQAKYADQGLLIVGVNIDKRRSEADQFLAEVPARFTIAFDTAGRTPRLYGVRGMPTSALVGPDGRILFVHSGYQPEDGAELEAQIVAALKAARP